MTATKICKTCERSKPLTDYKKLTPLMTARSPTGATHSNDCVACRLQKRADRKAQRDAEAQGGGEATTEQEPDTRPRMTVGLALGFDVVLEGEDFHVSQENGGETSTLIFTPHELRRLWEFAEELAHRSVLRQGAPAPEQPAA